MATLEERIQAIEQEYTALKQEHNALKKTIDLQTIAIGALVNKATIEKLNEKYDKLFEVIINHNRFADEQIAELRNQNTELDGKVVGLQTETRQQITELKNQNTELDGKVVGLQTEMRQRFSQIETTLALILTRLPENP